MPDAEERADTTETPPAEADRAPATTAISEPDVASEAERLLRTDWDESLAQELQRAIELSLADVGSIEDSDDRTTDGMFDGGLDGRSADVGSIVTRRAGSARRWAPIEVPALRNSAPAEAKHVCSRRCSCAHAQVPLFGAT